MSFGPYALLGNEGKPGFDWSVYDDGWNGSSLMVNRKIKTKKNEKVYCHETYAQELYGKYSGVQVQNAKDLKKGNLVNITDLKVIDDNTMMAVIGGGANNIIVDLNKETRLFEKFTCGDNTTMNKEIFVNAVKENGEFKQQILSMDLNIKIGTDTEKGSIWDGFVESLNKEMFAQIKLQNKAYWAEVIETNRGGFVVEVAGTVRAFMPGSMAASNRITDYDSYLGKSMEVMVESFTEQNGFVVSRKKYIQKLRPIKLRNYEDRLEDAPNTVYTGTVTGATLYGVYVELDEFITGMVHKTLASDELREAMRKGEVTPGTVLQVYGHKIENNRLILSDVAPEFRAEVIAKREAEDEAEKSAHLVQKAANATIDLSEAETAE